MSRRFPRIYEINNVDRGSDCEVRRAGKTLHPDSIWLAVDLFHFRSEITWLEYSESG